MHRQSRRKCGIYTIDHNTSFKLTQQTHPEGLPASPDLSICLDKNSLKDIPHLRHSKGHEDIWICLVQLPSGGTDTSLRIRALWKSRWKVRIAGTDHGPPAAFPLSCKYLMSDQTLAEHQAPESPSLLCLSHLCLHRVAKGRVWHWDVLQRVRVRAKDLPAGSRGTQAAA